MADAPPLSLLCRSSLPISHPESPGRRVSPAWPDWARSPASQLLPSALQALGLGPISCQGRGPLPGLARSPQRWHPGPGAHNGPRPLSPPPSPFLTGPLPTLGPPPGAAGDSAGLPLAPQPSRLGAPGPSPGRGGVRRPLLGRLPGLPRSFASDFFRGSFSRPRRREKVFLSSGSAMLGPGPGRVRARGSGHAAPRPPRPTRASPPAPRSAPAGSAFRECLAQTFFFSPSRGLSERFWDM